MKAFLSLLIIIFGIFTVPAQETAVPDPSISGSLQALGHQSISEENPGSSQQPSYVRPTASERRSRYLKGMFGLTAWGRNLAGAGISTWRNTPEEWGGKWEGFGKRVASNFGKRVIGDTVRYGMDEALRLDSSFYRSQNRSAGARIKNAVLSTVTARKPNGRRVIGVPRLIGTYSASVIAAETWYPRRYSYKDGLKSGTISLGVGTLFNLFREFVRR